MFLDCGCGHSYGSSQFLNNFQIDLKEFINKDTYQGDPAVDSLIPTIYFTPSIPKQMSSESNNTIDKGDQSLDKVPDILKICTNSVWHYYHTR